MNNPNRLILILSAVFLLSACSEKKQYEEAVLAEMQTEQDIKDYKLDPAKMAQCVVESTTKNMPGIFPSDPDRVKTYLAYIKMLSIKKAKDPQKMMDELRKEFGSAKGLLEARSNYTDSLVNCQTTLINSAEPLETAPATTAPAAASIAPEATPPVAAVPPASPEVTTAAPVTPAAK